MTSVRSLLMYCPFMILLSQLIGPDLMAQNKPPKGSATQQQTEENLDRGTNIGLRVEDMKVLIDNAIANKQMVTGLKARIVRKDILFDVTLEPNEAEEPWMILLNLSDEKFAEANQEYSAQGYRVVVDNTIVANRKTLHSVVWVRNAASQEATPLNLPKGSVPVTGPDVPGFEPLDELLTDFLREHNIPGATIAVSKNGTILYERGFGFAEIDPAVEMKPQAEMRIASISKPITAVAALQLVESGRLSLDASVIDLLKHPEGPAYPAPTDARWNQITVRDLLHHSGGWDRDVSKDPMFQVAQITQKKRLRHTANAFDIIRYQLQQPLDFEPGTRSAYSNFGYSILGRIIEEVTGQKYDEYVKNAILEPAGMAQTRLGKTRLADRGIAEVRYFTQKTSRHPAFWESVIGTARKTLPEIVDAPYGQWDLEVMDAHGGWVSTAGDLVRFAAALERTEKPLLRPETRQLLLSRPPFAGTAEDVWYGCGFNVRSTGDGGVNFWHNGGLAGTSTLLVRRSDGYSWAILFNTNETSTEKRCSDVIDPLLHRAINASTRTTQ